MKNLYYKLDVLITKLKYKYENSFISKILKNKIVFYLIWLIFVISFWVYLYIVITNSTHWFQRMFNHYVFKLDNVKEKFLYLSIFSWLYFLFYFQKKIFKFLKKFFLNAFTLHYLLYLWAIFLFVPTTKNQIIYWISPLVLFFVYKTHLYINKTKEKYKFKFIFDSRYFFLIALVLLIYTPIYLYFNDKKIAEQLSIYAYYFLVMGVIYEIIIWNFKK